MTHLSLAAIAGSIVAIVLLIRVHRVVVKQHLLPAIEVEDEEE